MTQGTGCLALGHTDFPEVILAGPPSPRIRGRCHCVWSEQCGPRPAQGQGDGMTSLLQVAFVGRWERWAWLASLHTPSCCAAATPQKLPGVLSVNEMWSLLLGGGEGTVEVVGVSPWP